MGLIYYPELNCKTFDEAETLAYCISLHKGLVCILKAESANTHFQVRSFR